MSRPDRRNAIIVAVLGAVAVIAAALIGVVSKKPEKTQPPVATTVDQSKSENDAKTTGAQSPAVAGGKDVTVNYGQTPTKDKPAK